MTPDYKLLVLQYLVQRPQGPIYVEGLNEGFFDLIEDKLTIQILKRYYKLYKTLPSKVTAQQFLEEQISATPELSEEMITGLRNNFEDIYISIPDNDAKQIEDTIILEIQSKSLQDTFMDYASNKISAKQVFTKVDQLASLAKIANTTAQSDGSFLISDRFKHIDEQIQGFPTFLEDLNKMTAAGGFYSPQLVIFMSGPKHFKTGLIIKMALEYMRAGARIYYADNENGVISIRNRFRMAVMNCTLPELYDPAIREELDNLLYKMGKYAGGDIYIDTYPAYSKSIKDVETRLTYLKEQHNWVPDIIIYDTIDKFIPADTNDQKRDVRIKIQLVYEDVINLNKKIGCFSFAPSQVNRHAIGKKVFDIKDLAEDFGKAMNAHAIFAICATDDEIAQGLRRIVPVAQREGSRYKQGVECIIKVDEQIMSIEEVVRESINSAVTDD